MSEIVLAQIWNAQWVVPELHTTEGQPLRVIYRGVWTHGLGPDFSGAYLDVDGRLITGDVEIHLRASSWFAHGHHRDPAYNSVALHVVLADDLEVPATRSNGTPLRTLVLCQYLHGPIETFAADPDLRPLGAIGFQYCAPVVSADDPEAIRRVWEQAGDSRLSAKVAAVEDRLAREAPAQALYALLLDALGYTRNRDGMRLIAERLPYDHLDAHLTGHPAWERWRRAAALLLGLGGFLPLSPRESELAPLSTDDVNKIEDAWRTHGTPWFDARLPAQTWVLTRQRPASHPLRRLLALATLLARLDVGLVEDLCAQLDREDAYRALLDWLTDENPYLGTAHAREMVVNVAVPFALAYGTHAAQDGLILAASRLWEEIPAGRGNADTRRTVEQICGPHPVPVRSARAEQGLLHIRRTGCALMRCYECPIAHLALRHAQAAANG